MMLYPTIPQMLNHVNSRYLLVNVIAKRARQISEAAEENDESLTEKPVTLAIREIADGKIKAHIEGNY